MSLPYELIQDILESLSEGIYTVNKDFRINSFNQAAEKITGYKRDDIPYLIRHFINKLSMTSHKKINDIDDEVMEYLMAFSWPGNIRELENAIEYAFARTPGNMIHLSKLPPNIKRQRSGFESVISQETGTTQKNELVRLLEDHHWNKSVVAKKLGIGRTTLWRKMKAMGLYE